MGNIANGELNTFVDGQIVSANDATYGLNPKMEVIRAAINDNDSRISVLEGQVGTLGGIFYNVKASPYNAVGDGIADDTVAIQAAITAASAVNGTVIIPKGTYKLTDSLTVSGGCSIRSEGSRSAVILKQTVVDKTIFTINSSYVRIESLLLDMSVTSTLGHIQSTTATAASPYTQFFLNDCVLYSSASVFCTFAIRLYNLTYSKVSNCSFGESGSFTKIIELYSCINFIISDNTLTNPIAFGIEIGRFFGSTVTYPQSANIVISGNNFINVSYDNILLNSVVNCYIDSNRFTKPSGTINFSFFKTSSVNALDNSYITLSNNYFDGRIGGSGNSTIGASLTYITQSIIQSNYFYECGTSLGCIYVQDSTARNLQISSNNFFQCLTYAVNFAPDTTVVTNLSVVSNNTSTDLYSNAMAASFVNHRSKTFLNVVGNSLVRGTKSATNVNSYGIETNYTTNDARILSSGNNFSAASSAPYSFWGSNIVCLYSEEISGDRTFYGYSLTAPSSGTYRQGDRLLPISPTAGGYIGYVCTTAGTPGTWKGFGAIQV